MEEDHSMRNRIIIALIGIIFFLLGFYNLVMDVKPVFESIAEIDTPILEYKVSESFLAIFFIVVGFMMYFIGRHWTYSFKSLTRLFVSIGILCITVAIILLPINSHANDLADSVQPSIDYMLAGQIDNLVDNQLEIDEGLEVTLILAENSETKVYTVSTLTNEEAEFIMTQYGIELYDDPDDNLFLGQVLVGSTYDQLIATDPNLVDTPLPISDLASQAEELGYDIQGLLGSLDIETLRAFYTVNEDAYLTALVSENTEEKVFTIGEVSNDDIELIWDNLDFPDSVSLESKRITTDMILTITAQQLSNSGYGDIKIPISLIGSQIPEDLKQIFAYDLLTDDILLRSSEIARVRDDCDSGEFSLAQVCDTIQLTKYDNFMANFTDIIAQSGISVPEAIVDLMESVNTVEKVEQTVLEKTDSWSKWLWTGIIFLVFAGGLYYMHFYLFHRELIPLHILYYVGKLNLFNYVPSFILIGIMYAILSSGIILDWTSSLFQIDGVEDVASTIIELPLYTVMLSILKSVMILASVYLVISLVYYLILFYLLKRYLDGYKPKEEVEKKEVKTEPPKVTQKADSPANS